MINQVKDYDGKIIFPLIIFFFLGKTKERHLLQKL